MVNSSLLGWWQWTVWQTVRTQLPFAGMSPHKLFYAIDGPVIGMNNDGLGLSA